MEFETIRKMLEERGQSHVLRWWNELDEAGRSRLAGQVASIDWEMISGALGSKGEVRGQIAPIRGLSLEEIAPARAEYLACGKEAIGAGKLACVLLAGGQGTRLGSNAPKGTFDIGITRRLYLFELLLRNLQEASSLCGASVPLYIMTSEENDAATRAFFDRHGFFGYPADQVFFFRQEMAPAVSLEGKLLLSAKDSLALSPNGNGGWYASLVRAGYAAQALSRGVEWFNVFSVDNVLQRMADPVFLGAVLKSGCASGAKFVRKTSPEERVGVLCLEDGRPSVIEYYELDGETARLRDGAGRLVYSYGMTLNYLFRADVLSGMERARLPVHVARKKVPYLNERGVLVMPEKENGCKFETLILDMVRFAGSCLPFEVERAREFAPVKNRTGVDSVETARALLEQNGVTI